ncbi:hypothetical protein [Streptomyces sp. MBT27]|uniref:hypothetical protein n=1 Tax=Streptomyces sp. MBT27 TaxID=1488356 RepID=UPI001423369C|nr:hypothetical protein [Streptomyces sp. MBT27]
MAAVSLLVEHDHLMRNPQFAARVRVAFTRIAREILTEDPSTPGYPLRVALARTVLNPGDWNAPGLAPVIAADPVISGAAAIGYTPDNADSAQASVTDDQIITAVRRAWNITAGVTPDPAP